MSSALRTGAPPPSCFISSRASSMFFSSSVWPLRAIATSRSSASADRLGRPSIDDGLCPYLFATMSSVSALSPVTKLLQRLGADLPPGLGLLLVAREHVGPEQEDDLLVHVGEVVALDDPGHEPVDHVHLGPADRRLHDLQVEADVRDERVDQRGPELDPLGVALQLLGVDHLLAGELPGLVRELVREPAGRDQGQDGRPPDPDLVAGRQRESLRTVHRLHDDLLLLQCPASLPCVRAGDLKRASPAPSMSPRLGSHAPLSEDFLPRCPTRTRAGGCTPAGRPAAGRPAPAPWRSP